MFGCIRVKQKQKQKQIILVFIVDNKIRKLNAW